MPAEMRVKPACNRSAHIAGKPAKGAQGFLGLLVLVLIASLGAPSLSARAASLSCTASIANATKDAPPEKLIVIGFMGGRVRPGNLTHRDARVGADLEHRYPTQVQAEVFANRDWRRAMKSVMRLIDRDGNGCLSDAEKKAARIVIYGHSWGASETVRFAQRLNAISVPVLLTVQVDSVQKAHERDGKIPPNVREAVNFYQTDGLLHGRSIIEAEDPAQTTILGNYASGYRDNPVACPGYSWYARAFMKSHIEIENDPVIWGRIETLIGSKVS